MARVKNIKRIDPQMSGSGLPAAIMPLSNNLAISSPNEKEDSTSGSEEKTLKRQEEDSTTDSEEDNYRCFCHSLCVFFKVNFGCTQEQEKEEEKVKEDDTFLRCVDGKAWKEEKER